MIRENICKIVMYHYVRPIQKSKYPTIKGLEEINFKKQIKYLKNNFKLITSEQLLDCIYENKEIPKNSILLTFDDGLKDHYSYVFPILKESSIQGLFFPTVQTITEKKITNVHKIQHILAKCENKLELVNTLKKFIKENKKRFNLQDLDWYYSKLMPSNRYDDKKIVFFKSCLQIGLPKDARNEFTDYFFKKYVTKYESVFAEKLYLTYDEINEMNENNMYFGSHGYSHEWLEFLSHNELVMEIEKCLEFHKKINKLEKDCIMCYPSGSYNTSVINLLKSKGFKAGLSLKVGDAHLNKKNAFTLERFDTNDFPQ